MLPPPLSASVLPPGKVAIVSGSGLNLESVLDSITEVIPFQKIPGMVRSTVQGHASRFIFGYCGGLEIIVQSGRLHTYEGLSFEEVSRPVHALFEFGARTVIYTNAVGALSPDLSVGALVGATKVNTWVYPSFNLPEEIAPDFCVPGCDAYGVNWWMHGPCYETRAEVRALQNLGALTVGMSTAPELIACAGLGVKCAVVSCATNNCTATAHVTHAEVLEAAHASAKRLAALLRNCLQPSS